LKILFVLHYANPFPGAAWARISFFAQFLKEHGHQVSINGAFSFKSLNRFGIAKLNGLQLYNITPIIMLNNTFSVIFNILSSVLTSFFLIIFNRPDVIVISVPKGDTAFGLCFVASSLRKKIIIDYRDEWEDYSISNAKTKTHKRLNKSLKNHMTKFYMKSKQVITTTEHHCDNLSKRGVKNVKLISNGADIKIFKPYDKEKLRRDLGFDENDFIFVYSGSIVPYYRVDLVVRAIASLIEKKHNVKLLLVGRGTTDKNLHRLIKKIGIENNIINLGEIIDRKDLAKILSASDVGLIPYDSNPLWKNTIPVKSLEYFACGLPAIATVYPDSILGKLITENQIGLISKPENVIALTKALEKIYNEPQFVKESHKRAYKLIQEKFDRNKLAQEFLKLLEE